MTEVEDLIYQFEGSQRELMLFLHSMLITDYQLTAKITFKNPCYYKKSWICYLKALKDGMTEIAFMRGNELSNSNGILKNYGRKQLFSLRVKELNDLPLVDLKKTLDEAILLDASKPYESKRTRK